MRKIEDLTGQLFNRLMVLGFNHRNKKGHSFWLCRCVCGNELIVRGDGLRNGKSKSCGCFQKEQVSIANRIDLVGRRFGRLIVEKSLERKDTAGCYFYLCKCDCGNFLEASGNSLTTGNTQSCGCIRNSLELAILLRNISPVFAKKLRHTYRGLKGRSLDKKDKNYGGRGITICERWQGKAGLLNFVKDMGAPPSLKSQIDRIDNDGPYSPENCRWTTQQQNCRNRRNTHLILFRGETKCLTEWVEELELTIGAVSSRLYRGWTEEEALSIPVRKRAKKNVTA